MPVPYDDLEDAVEFVSSSHDFDNMALVCKQSGKVFFSSNFDEEFDEYPDDADDPDKYAAIPSRHDLDLGRRLVSEFTRKHLPDEWDRIEAIFSRRGAYRRFKVFLAERGLLDAWHEFDNRRLKEAIFAWAESEGIEVVERQA